MEVKFIYKFLFIYILAVILIVPTNASTKYIRGVVNSLNVVREEPSDSAAAIRSDENEILTLGNPKSVEVLGEDGTYYLISFMFDGFIYQGYFPKSKITTFEYETKDEYKTLLMEKGFPEDYAEKLAILHEMHPNWSFEPSFTGGKTPGIDFNTAVNGEASVVARNLINTNNTSLRSTSDGAYANGNWIPLSGTGWFAASTQTIAFYMDPRNFLTEAYIFMFENLGYNSATQTDEVVNKIIKSTYLNNAFTCSEESYNCTLGTHTFLETIMTTAQDKKVSPVHLASRIVQEQGSNGSVLSLGMGYDGNYVGYYNFFNIGASGLTDKDVILNGLKYAYNKKWNNQFISIYDGASLIANNYIGRGQSTGYYQKFNTIVPTYYSNQYMQNVEAPYSEAWNSYSAYYRSFQTIEEWNESVYDFLIPIYSNMPLNTTLDASQNSDATLKSLEITSCISLNPTFQSSAYNYDCYIPTSVKDVLIKGETTNNMAKVEGLGQTEITSELMTINIVVTAVNGLKATYSINIHRIETDGFTPSEIVNGIGLKSNNSYIYNITIGTDVSNIINSIKNKYHFAQITITDSQGSELSSGIVKTGYKVVISNAGKLENYILILYGDINGDGKIEIDDLVPMKKHLIKTNNLSNAYLEAADINRNNKIEIDDLLYLRKNLLGQYIINQG